MYIRNLRKPSPNKNIYKFASAKNKAVVMCEGSLEFDCCFHLEYDPDVVSYKSQPKGYMYDYEGKQLPYTPDFLVCYSDGSSCLLEIKPYSKTLNLEFQARFQARKAAATACGVNLILVTDKQLHTGPFLDNCKLIHRYSGCIEGGQLSKTIHDKIAIEKRLTIRAIADYIKVSIGEVFSAVFRLISIGVASVNIESELLSENSVISVN